MDVAGFLKFLDGMEEFNPISGRFHASTLVR
jgi:hypothetical protein